MQAGQKGPGEGRTRCRAGSILYVLLSFLGTPHEGGGEAGGHAGRAKGGWGRLGKMSSRVIFLCTTFILETTHEGVGSTGHGAIYLVIVGWTAGRKSHPFATQGQGSTVMEDAPL